MTEEEIFEGETTPLQNEYYNRILNKVDYGTTKNIAYDLISDLSDRRGLSSEYDNIEDDIKEELIQTWIDIINLNLSGYLR